MAEPVYRTFTRTVDGNTETMDAVSYDGGKTWQRDTEAASPVMDAVEAREAAGIPDGRVATEQEEAGAQYASQNPDLPTSGPGAGGQVAPPAAAPAPEKDPFVAETERMLAETAYKPPPPPAPPGRMGRAWETIKSIPGNMASAARSLPGELQDPAAYEAMGRGAVRVATREWGDEVSSKLATGEGDTSNVLGNVEGLAAGFVPGPAGPAPQIPKPAGTKPGGSTTGREVRAQDIPRTYAAGSASEDMAQVTRTENAEMAEKFPGSTMMGGLLSGGATTAPLLAAFPALGPLAPLALAAEGTAEGFVSGAGAAPEGQRLEQGLDNAVVGFGVGGTAGTAAKVAGKVRGGMQNVRQANRARAGGVNRAVDQKLTEDFGLGEREAIGADIEEFNWHKGETPGAPASTTEVYNNLMRDKKAAGAEVGQITDELSGTPPAARPKSSPDAIEMEDPRLGPEEPPPGTGLGFPRDRSAVFVDERVAPPYNPTEPIPVGAPSGAPGTGLARRPETRQPGPITPPAPGETPALPAQAGPSGRTQVTPPPASRIDTDRFRLVNAPLGEMWDWDPQAVGAHDPAGMLQAMPGGQPAMRRAAQAGEQAPVAQTPRALPADAGEAPGGALAAREQPAAAVSTGQRSEPGTPQRPGTSDEFEPGPRASGEFVGGGPGPMSERRQAFREQGINTNRSATPSALQDIAEDVRFEPKVAPGVTVNLAPLAMKLEAQAQKIRAFGHLDENAAAEAAQLEARADAIRKASYTDYRTAFNFRSWADDKAYNAKGAMNTEVAKTYRELAGDLRNAIETAAQNERPEVYARLKRANKIYHRASQLERPAEQKIVDDRNSKMNVLGPLGGGIGAYALARSMGLPPEMLAGMTMGAPVAAAALRGRGANAAAGAARAGQGAAAAGQFAAPPLGAATSLMLPQYEDMR